jgi:3-phenylpropionate/trans-cinnamate dioxygenase ferredoxin reductase component
MSEVRRLVVAGASLAGLRAAQAARSAGFEGDLVVVGKESHPPYNRPPLSKDVLQGAQTADELAFPLGDLAVEWRLGTAVTGLDRAAHRVALADGEELGYDRLIVATGCRARCWRGTGHTLAGIHTLRTLEDSLELQRALEPGRHLVIVGAGFIGSEVAASARKRDVEVTLVDIAPHPMLPLGPILGERLAALHRANGVELRLDVGIEALHGDDGHVTHVELTGGERIAADAVLLALGCELNNEWLADSGIELDPGVVTDATLTSVSDPDILAAGDIASCPVALAGGQATRIEHWTTAAEHGRRAGQNALLDRRERQPHQTPPYFWSDQHGIKIQVVGLSQLAQETKMLEEDGERFVAGRMHQGRLVAVVAVNSAHRLVFYRQQLAQGPAELSELRS